MKPVFAIAGLVLSFCAGATVVGLYRGPEVRAALAKADSLQVRVDSLKGVSDSLHRVVGRTDTLRVTAWTKVAAAAKLAPPACAPLITAVHEAQRTDSGEIADLKKENAALRQEVADDDSANAALRTAAKKATGGLVLFHLFRFPVKLAPSLSVGADVGAPTKPKLFISVVSIGL